MKAISFDIFKRTFKKGRDSRSARFIEMFGYISFEEAYPIYLEMTGAILGRKERIENFERFLQSKVEHVQSNISESRYYNYNGMKYRFSSHVYPTGSMTSENCVDFAADPQLIDNIKF